MTEASVTLTPMEKELVLSDKTTTKFWQNHEELYNRLIQEKTIKNKNIRLQLLVLLLANKYPIIPCTAFKQKTENPDEQVVLDAQLEEMYHPIVARISYEDLKKGLMESPELSSELKGKLVDKPLSRDTIKDYLESKDYSGIILNALGIRTQQQVDFWVPHMGEHEIIVRNHYTAQLPDGTHFDPLATAQGISIENSPLISSIRLETDKIILEFNPNTTGFAKICEIMKEAKMTKKLPVEMSDFNLVGSLRQILEKERQLLESEQNIISQAPTQESPSTLPIPLTPEDVINDKIIEDAEKIADAIMSIISIPTENRTEKQRSTLAYYETYQKQYNEYINELIKFTKQLSFQIAKTKDNEAEKTKLEVTKEIILEELGRQKLKANSIAEELKKLLDSYTNPIIRENYIYRLTNFREELSTQIRLQTTNKDDKTRMSEIIREINKTLESQKGKEDNEAIEILKNLLYEKIKLLSDEKQDRPSIFETILDDETNLYKNFKKIRPQIRGYIQKLQDIAQSINPENITNTSTQIALSFSTLADEQQCFDEYNTGIFFEKDSYFKIVEQIIKPLIGTLSDAALNMENPEITEKLLIKLLSGELNNNINTFVKQKFEESLKNKRPFNLLDIKNLLDEDLVTVYDRAKLFIGSEKHPLTDGQTKQLNEILAEIKFMRKFIGKTLAETRLKQIKNRKISFTLSDVEKEGLTLWQIEEKRQTQIDQICAMVEIAELARTTENPEVLKAIMEQKCFKSNLDILLTIAQNPKVDTDTLHNCANAIMKIAPILTDKDQKIKAIKILSAIAQNPEADADTLDNCAEAIGNIASTLTDEKNKIEALNIIFEIVKNKKANGYTLNSCADAIGQITKTLTDKGKKMELIKEIYNIISKIVISKENKNMSFYGCLITIEETASILPDEDQKIKAINILSTIAQKKEDDSYTLGSCADAIGQITKTLTDKGQKMKAINEIYNIISKTVKNKEKDKYALHCCADAIEEIAPILTDEDQKIKAIKILSAIAQNKKADKDTLRSCADAIGQITKTLKNSDLRKMANEIMEIIITMRRSMSPYQTIQKMPEERQTQFVTNIQTKIDEINKKMEEIREKEEEKEISVALGKLFDESKPANIGSSQVNAAATVVSPTATDIKLKEIEQRIEELKNRCKELREQAGKPKEQTTEKSENPSVVGEHTAELVAVRAMTSDGNLGQSQQ